MLSPISTPTATTKTVKLRRSKNACKPCNTRRVRCNVQDCQPCDNCRKVGAQCEIAPSIRGKYKRTRRDSLFVANPSYADAKLTPSTSLDPSSAPVTAHGSVDNAFTDRWANHMEDSLTSTTSSPSVLGGETESTVFLGESSSIGCAYKTNASTVTDFSAPFDQSNLRYPLLSAGKRAYSGSLQSHRIGTRIATLTEEGVLTLPDVGVCRALFQIYFKWFHPNFPVVDRQGFSRLFASGDPPVLLTYAILFIGASYAEDALLRDLGLGDRHEVRYRYFIQAKDIYDSDYEGDVLMTLQSLFLMSFWRAGPLLEKDTRHWLGDAISLAQKKGLHRSNPDSSSTSAKIRKRIWWSLYIRERQCCAALGLPCRIHDEDCDIEELNVSDFDEDRSCVSPEIFGLQTTEHVHYAIQMSKLAKLLGQTVATEFRPAPDGRADDSRRELKHALLKWESDLPAELKGSGAMAGLSSFWANLLHLTYNNLFILLYRSKYLECNVESAESDNDGHLTLKAACRNTRIVEDMLSSGVVRYGHIHMITSLFNSLCIHVVHLDRSETTARKVAEHRAQLCLLGLKELQKTWDVNNWVLDIFLHFLDRNLASRLLDVDDEEPAHQILPYSSAASSGKSSALQSQKTEPQIVADENGTWNGQAEQYAYVETQICVPPSFIEADTLCDEDIFQLYAESFGASAAREVGVFEPSVSTMQSKDLLSAADVTYLAKWL